MIPHVKIGERRLIYGLDEDTIVWKKAIAVNNSSSKEVIVKLTIPKNAKVVISNYKCRASYAKVEGIYPIGPCEPPKPLDIKNAWSWYNLPLTFSYRVGEIVYPDAFDISVEHTCSSGIHFFRTYIEAVEYDFL